MFAEAQISDMLDDEVTPGKSGRQIHAANHIVKLPRYAQETITAGQSPIRFRQMNDQKPRLNLSYQLGHSPTVLTGTLTQARTTSLLTGVTE